ncbi:MAG: DUF756 domain-containing protein, partial [Nocardiopsaceae bacterium]|nr:DUF756 domain-containing protein [Nocardiopsaceae bacterium]
SPARPRRPRPAPASGFRSSWCRPGPGAAPPARDRRAGAGDRVCPAARRQHQAGPGAGDQAGPADPVQPNAYLTGFSGGTAGLAFTNNGSFVRPSGRVVSGTGEVGTGSGSTAAGDTGYDITVTGPNRFLRRFTGDTANSPGTRPSPARSCRRGGNTSGAVSAPASPGCSSRWPTTVRRP